MVEQNPVKTDSQLKYKRRADGDAAGDPTVKRSKYRPNDEEKKKPVVLTKEDRKELRKKRKSEKKHAETAEQLLKLFEVGVSNMKKKERDTLLAQIVDQCKGKFHDLALRHDTARAIQLAIKHSNKQQRSVIVKELSGKYYDLCRNKTGHFVVLKVVQYGSIDEKQIVLNEFRGKIRKLAILADGAQVLDYLYMTASKTQQYTIIRELMDQSFAVFKNDSLASTLKFQSEEKHATELKAKAQQDLTNEQLKLASMTESEINQQPQMLLSWLIARDPERKTVMLDSLELFINRIIGKEMMMFRFFHSILRQYLDVAPIESSAKREIISSINKYLLAVHDSKDGVACALHAVAYGTAKDRKNAVKAIKGRVVDLCLHEYAYMIVVKVMDSTDDSVLVRKQILSELIAPTTFGVSPYLFQLCVSKPGAKVLYYLLAPHTSAFFSKLELAALQPVYVPAFILNKKQKEDKEDEEPKDGEDKEKVSDKDLDIAAKEGEKARLARKAAELAEAQAITDAEMVKTSKKDVNDKVYELGAVVLESLIKTWTLTMAEARGVAGQGSLSTSNMNIVKKQKKMTDEDNEDEDEDDDEDAMNDHEVEVSVDDTLVTKPFAVLNGVMKHRVGLEVMFTALTTAYTRDLKAKADNKPKSPYASAVAAADAVIDVMANLCAEGDVWDQDHLKFGSEKNDDGFAFNDDSHPLINSCSHLLFKRLFQALPEEPRNVFAEKVWANITKDQELLERLVQQNRFGFVMAHMLDHTPMRATGTKVISKLMPKQKKDEKEPFGVALLRRVLAGGSSGKEAPKADKPTKKASKSEEEVTVSEPEPKATPAKGRRATKRVAEVEEVEAVPVVLAQPTTPLRRSARISSNPPTPQSTSLTPRRSARHSNNDELTSFSLENVEDAPVTRAKSPRNKRAPAVPTIVEEESDEEEIAEVKKTAKKAATRKTRK